MNTSFFFSTASKPWLLSSMLALCAVPALAQSLTPPEARISDAAIGADLQQFEAQQQRLRSLNSTGRRIPLSDYSMAKAQCWLDVARHEYARNDRSAFPELALQQSQAIARYLEQGAAPQGVEDPALASPLINGAERLREDLWAQAATLKKAPGATCVQALVACAEVELVHAGHEQTQLQWRHAAPYVGMAEQQLARAQRGAEACAAAEAAKPAPVLAAAPRPAQPAPAPVVSTQKWTLSGDALFKFNRSDLASLLPGGREALERLALSLRQDYQRIDHVQVVGHTDHLGSAARNDHLAWRRAETVRDRLLALQVSGPIAAYGMGPRQPIHACPDALYEKAATDRKPLIACLQPNRRVEIAVVGVRFPVPPSSTPKVASEGP
ncbi:OmpA family protein [Roseateles sp.]|uniref:OmpA family protein n=1 Tax=Roseateles sp. TaxID=1971397 RepID=UPI003BA7AC65